MEDLNTEVSIKSAYELDLEKEVENAEEFKNQFYDGLEAQEDLFETKSIEGELNPNPDEDDEDIDNFINEIDGDKFASLPIEEEGPSKPSKIRSTLQPLAPVKLTEFKEIEIEEPVSTLTPIDYRTFLHQEIGETKEMYKMREKISHLISEVEVPRGKSKVSLDAQSIIVFARMITNKLWFGMRYNKEQEELIQALLKYIPDMKL